MESSSTYPLFHNPQDYLLRRRGGRFLGPFKRFGERLALSRCLRDVEGIRTVCDGPCGPGRLFPYWRSRGFRIIGVDLSESMVEAANQTHRSLQAEGAVLRDDAFHLGEILPEPAELVASIRFAYYFDREKRVVLLRSLACASRRYVLVEYKTRETLKGRITESRQKRRHGKNIKRFCSHRDIMEEVKQAGLLCVRIVPIGEFSDRAFVLAEKPPDDSAPSRGEKATEISTAWLWRPHLAVWVFVMLGIIYLARGAVARGWTAGSISAALLVGLLGGGLVFVLRGMHWKKGLLLLAITGTAYAFWNLAGQGPGLWQPAYSLSFPAGYCLLS